MVGHDGALGSLHADGTAIFNDDFFSGGVGESLQLARRHRLINEVAGDFLRARRDQTRIRVPHGALNGVFFEKREALFGFGCGDHARVGTKSFARCDLAQQFLHLGVVALACHFHTANFNEVTAGLIKLAAVGTGEHVQLVVAGHVAEVRGVRGRADVGGDGRFLEANDVIPAVLHQMVRHRGAHDATLTNNHHTRFFG